VEVVVCPMCLHLGCESEPQLTVKTRSPHEVIDNPFTALISGNTKLDLREFSKYRNARCPECGSTPVIFKIPTQSTWEAVTISSELAKLYDEGRYAEFIEELARRSQTVHSASSGEIGDLEIMLVKMVAKKLAAAGIRKKRPNATVEQKPWRGEKNGQTFYAECARCGEAPEMTVRMRYRISSLGKVVERRIEKVSFSCSSCGSSDVVFRVDPSDDHKYRVTYVFEEDGYRAIAEPFV